jgi:sugar lactone lactonase YvrE
MTEVECVWDAQATLGEGPIWDDEARTLYWVDILGQKVHCYSPAEDDRRSWSLPEPVGCIAQRRRGGFVAGLKSGFAFLSLEGPRIEPIGSPEPDLPDNRFNDGKCDSRGRFWAGTMDMKESEPTGWLYRLDSDGNWTRTDGGYRVTNGPTFSPDYRILYHTDSAGRTIYAFDVTEEGRLVNKRVFASFQKRDGFPDGMTTDSEGCLWVAMWGGWGVNRLTQDGKLDRRIELPVSQVSSCVFGGPELDLLYITSASIGLDTRQRSGEPRAGGLFRVPAGVRGLPTQRFAG